MARLSNVTLGEPDGPERQLELLNAICIIV